MTIKENFIKSIAKSTIQRVKDYNELYPKKVITIQEVVDEIVKGTIKKPIRKQ